MNRRRMDRRRHMDDDEDGYDRLNNKRRKVPENQDIEDRLEALILHVGEKASASLESNLEGLVSVLEADLTSYRSKVLRIMSEAAIRMPEKCTIYATLVGLLNVKSYSFGGEFVETMVRHLKESLKSCKWEDARYCLRFLSELVNCHVISAGSMVTLFDNLLDAVKEENVPGVRKDWFAYAVLSCLPWIGRELYEKKEQALNMIMATIEVYLNKRIKKHANLLKVWASDDPHPQEEYLDCLWAQVNKLRESNWVEKYILRPYLAFDGILCEALQHNVPSLLPPPHYTGATYPPPWVIFRMFDYTDCMEGPILPGAHSIERYLIEEKLHQIIEMYHYERKECAVQLMNFTYTSSIPLEHCVIEVIFAELMHLPAPRYIQVFYASLLLELCRLKPLTFPPVLVQATEMFFYRIENMHVACFDRLVNWFSHHLSNFMFRFTWDDWEPCLQLNSEHPQPKFIKEVLIKCMRLSYHQQVCEMVKEPYEILLPQKPGITYKYAPEKSEIVGAIVERAQEILQGIKTRVPTVDMLEILQNISPDYQVQIDVFVQTLLFHGYKSINHSFNALGRYHETMKMLVDTEEKQLYVMKSLYSFWRTNQQMLTVIVDKLLKTQILNCSSVANWVFSLEMKPEFTKMYIWEILYLTVHRMSQHVRKLNRDLHTMRERLKRQNRDSDSEDEEEEIKKENDAEMKPTLEKVGDVVMDSEEASAAQSSPLILTEEMVEKMEEKLEMAQCNQKNLFLIIFQRFIMNLSEHLVQMDTDGVPFDNYWYKWTIGRLQQVFLQHYEEVQKYVSTLETLLFTQDLDPHILEIFQQFVSLQT